MQRERTLMEGRRSVAVDGQQRDLGEVSYQAGYVRMHRPARHQRQVQGEARLRAVAGQHLGVGA